MPSEIINGALFALPILAGIVMSVMSERRYFQKWAFLYTSCWALVAEIYKYRCRVDQYDLILSKSKVPEEAEDQDRGVQAAGASVSSHRDNFAAKVNSICKFCYDNLDEDCVKDGDEYKNLDAFDIRPRIISFLQSEVYRSTPQSLGVFAEFQAAARTTSRTLASIAPQAPHEEHGRIEELVKDDFFSELPIENYVEYRLKLLKEASKSIMPKFVATLHWIKLAGLLFTFLSSILVLCKLNRWVPLCLAIQAALFGISKQEMLTARLAAHNLAIEQLQSLELFLKSLSIVKRRTRQTMTHAVLTTEAAVMNTIQMWTCVSATSEEAKVEADEDNEAAEQKNQKNQKK